MNTAPSPQAEEIGTKSPAPPCESLAAKQLEKEILILKARTSRAKEIWIPLLSTIVALAGVLSGVLGQSCSAKTQLKAKQLEVTFEVKRAGYSSLLPTLNSCFLNASHRNRPATLQCLDKAQAAYFSIEPFLRKQTRDATWTDIQEIEALCVRLNNVVTGVVQNELTTEFINRRDRIRDRLQGELFTDILR